MATAILKPLRRLCPQSKVGFWAKSYTAGLFKDQPLIDRVHASDTFWDKSPGFARGGFRPFIRTLAEIRREKYEAAFILNTEWRRSLACRLAGIPQRIGYAWRKSGFFLTGGLPAPLSGEHFVDDHRKLVQSWAGEAVKPEDCLPRLDLTKDEIAWWDEWSAKAEAARRQFIAIHLFSGDEKKNWPLPCWAQLIQGLSQTHPEFKFAVICGPGEEPRLTPIRSQRLHRNVVELVNPSLTGLKAVLGHAAILLGGDSGLGHVAAALGTPVLSLFGTGSPQRSRPMGRALTAVIEKRPLQRLLVPEVRSRVEELLERASG